MMKIGASGFLTSFLGITLAVILETVPKNHVGPYASDNQMILLYANMISFVVMSIGAMGHVAEKGL